MLFLEDLKAQRVYSGTTWHPMEYAAFSHSFATDGGAVGTIDTGILLPAGFVLWDGCLDIITGYTSAGAATVAIRSEAAADILAATAVASLVAGRFAIIPVGTPATSLKMTANRTVQVVIATAALTAGKMYGYLRGFRSLTT